MAGMSLALVLLLKSVSGSLLHHPLHHPQSSPRRSPCHPRGPGSNWGSRRSSWNSLSRAPSLKRKDTSRERESLLAGVGRGSFEDDESEGEGAGRAGSVAGGPVQSPGSLDFPDIQLGSGQYQSGEYHDCNGRVMHIPPSAGSDLTREDSNTDEDLEEVSYIIHI